MLASLRVRDLDMHALDLLQDMKTCTSLHYFRSRHIFEEPVAGKFAMRHLLSAIVRSMISASEPSSHD